MGSLETMRAPLVALCLVVAGCAALPEQASFLEEGEGEVEMVDPAAAMAALTAGPGAAGGAKSEGIKEALAAVKPIMDKYVNTAKTLSAKYSALKKSYDELKATKAGKATKEAMEAAKVSEENIKTEAAKDEESLKVRLEQSNKNADKAEASLQKKVQALMAQNAELRATNKDVTAKFETELENARKMAHKQVQNMRMEVDRYMSESNKDQFNQMKKATAKALEEKETLKLEKESLKDAVKKTVEEEAEHEEGDDDDDDEEY